MHQPQSSHAWQNANLKLHEKKTKEKIIIDRSAESFFDLDKSSEDRLYSVLSKNQALTYVPAWSREQ